MARDGDSRPEKSKRNAKDSENSSESSMDSQLEHHRKHSTKRRKHRISSSRKRYSDDDYSDSGSESESGSESDSEYSDSESEDSESEEERRRRRRKRRERKKREEKKRRRREKDRKRRKRGEDEDDDDDDDKKKRKRRKMKMKKEKEKKKKKEKGKPGAVTDSWGKYGVVREVDMWSKRPEFTAWLSEVKQVNLESLSNWEEKKMFKEYMEDYNTATFPSKKYYDLDAYHSRKVEKEMKKGFKKVVKSERTVFNDEEQRRQELMQAREKQKEQEVEALKCAMKSGMAQAMKEQALLKEEMTYLFKIGNIEAATAIQKKLDPDVLM
ncbi:vicilin-like seed storage protein At2g18540 [Amaranthus tricolor]|uniref:vicilin-like seed storage protein At2g18540 n=1 Tax=Amaranthus tricolor TaxID=29722 RepID=UPI0025887195|nr:vicilin-like seed storage protein At2g18540 [Amaranthus tricolor]